MSDPVNPPIVPVTVVASGVGIADPTFAVGIVLVPPGRSMVVWNMVTVGTDSPTRCTFRQDIGIVTQPVDGVTISIPPGYTWRPEAQTQWAVLVDNQAAATAVSSYKINSDDAPSPHDPTIIFTTDPVIPPLLPHGVLLP